MISNTTTRPSDKPDPWSQSSVYLALTASTAISGFGIVSAFWDGLISQNPAAYAGAAAVAAGAVATEIGAIALANALTRDGLRVDAATFVRGAAFAAATAVNVFAGHFGAEAINDRLVESARAPYESRLQTSTAALTSAERDLAEFRTEADRQRAALEDAIARESAAAPNAVTARGRQAQAQRAALSARLEDTERTLRRARADAEQEKAAAQSAMAEAPKGFGALQMWGIAAILELLKGILVWLTAPRRRRPTPGATIAIQPAEVRGLTNDELEAAWESLSAARSLNTTIWHELRRRQRKAA